MTPIVGRASLVWITVFLLVLASTVAASHRGHGHLYRHHVEPRSTAVIPATDVVLSSGKENTTDDASSMVHLQGRLLESSMTSTAVSNDALASTRGRSGNSGPLLVPNPHQRVHHGDRATDQLLNHKDLQARQYDTTTNPLPSATETSTPTSTSPTISFAAGPNAIPPSIIGSALHGSSSNNPSQQYVQTNTSSGLPQLPSDDLTVGVDGTLSTAYALAPDTGVVLVDESTQDLLADLDGQPHLSRDGGKGGYLNGQKIFMFCDTGSYTAPSSDSSSGSFLGFVSSSVAIDIGLNGGSGQALTLQDGIGEWSDNAGRMRGFSPLTLGEQSYNLVMQGQGQRYAVWPESSLIPLNQTTALLYAPIIYDNVDETTKKAVFTYTGTTLLTITIQAIGGPRADRIVDKLFDMNEVEWGTIGGLRSYGPSGIGGNDGKVYIFGNSPSGLLLARASAQNLTSRDSYEYWAGWGWSPGMQRINSTAHFVTGAFMDGDIFYSPAHLTFLFIYLNPYADNTFYIRYLQADHAILPPFAPGGDPTADYAENLVKYPWSDPQVLYKAAPGPTGMYIYAGGVHQGYFDEDDVVYGGKKMLLSWTVPTGANPAQMESEYDHMTAQVTFA